jgi:hypothetical protein
MSVAQKVSPLTSFIILNLCHFCLILVVARAIPDLIGIHHAIRQQAGALFIDPIDEIGPGMILLFTLTLTAANLILPRGKMAKFGIGLLCVCPLAMLLTFAGPALVNNYIRDAGYERCPHLDYALRHGKSGDVLASAWTRLGLCHGSPHDPFKTAH